MDDNYEEMKLPNKLVVIGNGFDLALDAKTSYADFYSCLKECYDAESIEVFRNSFISTDNEQLINSFYELVQQEKNNYFINYFIKYKRIFGNWVSFEKELTKIIKCFDTLISHLTSSNKVLIDVTDDNYACIYLDILDEPDLLSVLRVNPCNKFFTVHMEPKDINWNDGKIYFGINNTNYKDIYEVHRVVSDFSEAFPLLLYKEMTIFSNLFSLYLGIVRHFTHFNNIIDQFFDSAYFINYNFTDYLEKTIINNDLYCEGILYINGLSHSCMEKANDNVVFGIDSNTKLKNIGFEIFTKRLQRSINNTDVIKLSQFMKNDFNDIIILGHSLNMADYESLHYIFHKCEESGAPNITVFYYDEEARINLIINLKLILGNDKFDEYQRNNKIRLINSKKVWIKKKTSFPLK